MIASVNNPATWRSARFSALGSTSVGRHWWGSSPGFGDRLVDADRCAVTAGGLGKVVVAHASAFVLDVRAVWAAIQMATPTREPIPTSQANRPSLTGPMPPRPNPP